MLTISKIAHVNIRVPDIERTLDFYVNKLGMEEVMRLDRDGRLWLIYLRITDDQFLEIFPEGEGDEVPGPQATGYHHMCLAVPDIHKAVEELGAAGIPLLLSEKLGADGNWQCWIKDPDGNRIELMQLMPDSLQEQGIAKRRGAGNR